MTSSAEILSNFESCARWGYWSRSWRRHRMTPTEMLMAAVREALTQDVPDPGEYAGETMVTLAGQRGLEIDSRVTNLYRCVMNHAAIANLIVTAIRIKQSWWLRPESTADWQTSAFLSPDKRFLRRFIAVSHWGEDREFFERHSWYVAGEIAHYQMPMELVVAVIGPMNAGRRHSHWAKALLHPFRSQLRFRLRHRAKVEGFAETWQPIYREEHDEIERAKWLSAMMMDEVLEELLFVVPVPVPDAATMDELRELARRPLPSKLPPKQLSTCHNPLHPCPFRVCCWSSPESRPEDGGFDRLTG